MKLKCYILGTKKVMEADEDISEVWNEVQETCNKTLV